MPNSVRKQYEVGAIELCEPTPAPQVSTMNKVSKQEKADYPGDHISTPCDDPQRHVTTGVSSLSNKDQVRWYTSDHATCVQVGKK